MTANGQGGAGRAARMENKVQPLHRGQVIALPSMRSAITCTRPGCVRLADQGEVCSYHLQQSRREAGLCANCGGERERTPVLNELLGRQQVRYGQLVWAMRCTRCGRMQRPYVEKER